MDYAELTKEFNEGELLCCCGCDEVIKRKQELTVDTEDEGKILLPYKAAHYARKIAK